MSSSTLNGIRPSILIIHHGQGIGGGLIALIGLVEELKDNYKVHVLSIFDGIAVDYIRQTGVAVTVANEAFYTRYYQLLIHSDASYFNIIDSFRSAKSLALYFLSKYFFAKKELAKFSSSYDTIYLNSTFITDWAYAAKQFDKKVIIHIREPLSKGLFGFRRSIIRNTIDRYCDKIIAVSYDNSHRIALESKTTVVYDPVVIKNRIHSTGIMKSSKFRNFVYLGGMSRIKGFQQLVESLKYLDEDVRIYFLGGSSSYSDNGFKRFIRLFFDPFFLKNQQLIDVLNKANNIILVGLVDDVFKYYEDCIAVICPFSKPHASLPILEAFSFGRPVIVSDVKGMNELVDCTNGVFFMNSNPESLAQKINAMSCVSELSYEAMRVACFLKYKSIRDETESVTSVVSRM